ncbi:hypothetical protein BCR41DRAFT_373414 [Lobosporangium transversale]|uniref:Uncharacterized protein n=1 Tax=Lobosporangium transversale TaxID=64571 RepID=A0A1Y2GHZ7_9FUNG|nr:hypothetical protein BCR41DRAFT_373414 [Lobosporangium transversale]ORZ08026.1 hypothetical protein BCR41DRAFT_373414 [Lobosporangium transversale]|eukprot:XP_021878260.1 hypothetical protein BCR41DRAFT_373414 [Lobosporangium transversale]
MTFLVLLCRSTDEICIVVVSNGGNILKERVSRIQTPEPLSHCPSEGDGPQSKVFVELLIRIDQVDDVRNVHVLPRILVCQLSAAVLHNASRKRIKSIVKILVECSCSTFLFIQNSSCSEMQEQRWTSPFTADEHFSAAYRPLSSGNGVD